MKFFDAKRHMPGSMTRRFLRPKSKDTHVAIAINSDRTGLVLKVDSNALKGRGTVLRLKLERKSEKEIKTALMFGAASLAMRQNELWKDNHDIKEVQLKAAEAWYAICKDNKLVHGLGTLVPYAAYSPGNEDKPADRVSRASADDPLTRDIIKGKNKDWGLDS
jgi:hypothetical protein